MGLAGCRGQVDSSVDLPSVSAPRYLTEKPWLDLQHDVGELLAGVESSHTFLVKNTFGETIEIKRDQDIIPNCGCSEIAPTTRRLAPGEETAVRVKVRTLGKSGPFLYGGWIVWTGPNDAIHVTRLRIRGTARPPLQLEPESLEFTPDELAKGTSKTMRVTPAPAVKLESLTAEVSEGQFTIAKIGSEGAVLIYAIRCSPASAADADETLGTVEFRGRLLGEQDGVPISVTAQLLLQQPRSLSVRPKVIEVEFEPGQEHVTTRVILSGEALDEGDLPIRSLSCADYGLQWKATRTGKAAVIHLTFSRNPDDNHVTDSVVSITLRGMDPMRVPLRVRER